LVSGYETILLEKRDHVAHISLNRPSALNAYNIPMRDDFSEALAAVEIDDEVRCLIISGQGRAFCAGADLTEFGTAPSQVVARQVRWERDVWGQLNNLSIPTVAAVHGYCIGSGIEIMLLCDLRIAAYDTIFAMPELHLGMIPAAGGSQTLPRNCGPSAALDLLLTGRRIDGKEALGLGLVTRVAPPEELMQTAWDMAERLGGDALGTASCVKRAIREGLDLGLKEGLELEKRLGIAVCRG
jgi:enoyl-CoA hydratase/carnithine racemase